ncbi:phosphomannose isomerase type II C-terminal cupin domain [Vallicoccus soli]|uniref:Cupin domain-containing protein n=1 Tax=Vallicoccus soli TaxID=2339232 RepID=A0A3A3ZN39_9ACTN|nr:phosphomannose isomerase type II C-terminal cupin domain [Vallicoccus soli]RJK98185.1 cupin domain-containing protein [Vallicoccus soli]
MTPVDLTTPPAPRTGGSVAPSLPVVVTDERPWGRFDLLTLNQRSTVKVLTVDPGCRLSLQRHTSRDEWWTALDPGLEVEVGGRTSLLTVGERVWIPRGTTHRVRCTGSAPARFLEVAFGDFDECDIERLEDDYARLQPDATAQR